MYAWQWTTNCHKKANNKISKKSQICCPLLRAVHYWELLLNKNCREAGFCPLLRAFPLLRSALLRVLSVYPIIFYASSFFPIHCKKSDFWFVKSTGAKLKVKECNVLFSVILFCIIFAKEIIFVLSSIMVLVCNITFLKSNMTFVKSMIHIIEWMCYELLYTHVVVLVKIGRVLFSYYMYFLHYWLFAGLGIFAL